MLLPSQLSESTSHPLTSPAAVWQSVDQLIDRLWNWQLDSQEYLRQERATFAEDFFRHHLAARHCIDWSALLASPNGRRAISRMTASFHLASPSVSVQDFTRAVTVRVMEDIGFDRNGGFSGFEYFHPLLDEVAIAEGELFKRLWIEEAAVDVAPVYVGFFNNEGHMIGLASVDKRKTVFDVFDSNSYELPQSILTGHFESFWKKEQELTERASDLIDYQNSHRPLSLERFDLERSKQAWEHVILPPERMAELLRASVLFAAGHPAAPKGILLKGSPGTGKTIVAKAMAEASSAHVICMSAADIKGQYIGETSQKVKAAWEEAREKAPTVLIIDECEGVFGRRGGSEADSFSNELVQVFLSEWDGLGAQGEVLVVGTTNRADLLDDAIVSRFTDVMELPPATKDQRARLVNAIARQLGINVTVPQEAVDAMGGMSGRDVRTTLQQSLRLSAPDAPDTSHYEAATAKVRGKTSTATNSNSSWDSLVLEDSLKERLQVLCEMVRDAEGLMAANIPVPRTLLLTGPAGTGKTQIARTIAQEAGISFISKSTSELKGQFVGQAAAKVAQTFETARSQSPCIVFIDEIDALTSARGSSDSDSLRAECLVQLLQELDGVAAKPGHVFVVGATNCFEMMDPAIRSRFGESIEIGLPDEAARTEILKTLLKDRPVAEALDLRQVAKRCAGFSGRDLRELITRAFSIAVRRVLSLGRPPSTAVVQAADFQAALA